MAHSPLSMKTFASLLVASVLLLAPSFGIAESSSSKKKPCSGLEGQALRDCRAGHPKAMANTEKKKIVKHMKRKAHGLAQKKCKGLTGEARAKCAQDTMQSVKETVKQRHETCAAKREEEKTKCMHEQRRNSSSATSSSSASSQVSQ